MSNEAIDAWVANGPATTDEGLRLVPRDAKAPSADRAVTPDHGDGPACLRRGDCVRVRSLSEILATLDVDAKFEGLPFMPEMVPHCGRTFQVYRRAEKTCVEGIGVRSISNTVFLTGLRCDGSAHGGCQRDCLLFWKEAWLTPADDRPSEFTASEPANLEPQRKAPAPQRPYTATQLPTVYGDRFCCQSTELAEATRDLPPGKLGHYLRDLRMGEITVRRFAYILWLALANRVWRLLYGRGFCQIAGNQKKTRSAELNLQPGEWVEVKPFKEILATLDAQGRNRGLTFEAEMARHCGRRYRVATPVRNIISEVTGQMLHLGNTVILEGVVCQGICMKNCPRANHFYWREIWLRRI